MVEAVAILEFSTIAVARKIQDTYRQFPKGQQCDEGAPTMAAMLTYLSNFFSGEVDPLWPHIALLTVSVLASFAVAGGIILESPKYSAALHRVATCLVIGGVAMEALCTIVLFVFDEGISAKQQEKIIALEMRLAPRLISGKEAMIARLKEFSGVPFDVAIQTDSEEVGFMSQLTGVLEKAGWAWKPIQGSTMIFNVPSKPAMGPIIMSGGVAIRISKKRLDDWGKAVEALADALRAEKLTALAQADDVQTDTAIHISIGAKE